MRQGFTLIEIMVAVSIFAIVAVVTTGALVTASNVNRKAQAIKLAIDNVSFAMDSMVLNLRDGSNYGCLEGNIPDDPNDYLQSAAARENVSCVGGGQGIIFTSRRVSSAGLGGGQDIIYRRADKGSIQVVSSGLLPPQYVDITSPEVNIISLKFYIPPVNPLVNSGGTPLTPRVTMVIQGQVAGKTPTNFVLQTSVKTTF